MMRRAGRTDGGQQDHHDADHDPQAVQRSTVHDVLRTAGRPLDTTTRTDMESRLGADFSGVRIHDDASARASAAEVGARAYTSGDHVVTGEGGGDRHTLAHELTHVIQQRQGPVAGTDHGDGLKVSDPSDRFEREAEANAHRALSAPGSHDAPSGHESPGGAGPAHGDAQIQRYRDPAPTGDENAWREESRQYVRAEWQRVVTSYARTVLRPPGSEAPGPESPGPEKPDPETVAGMIRSMEDSVQNDSGVTLIKALLSVKGQGQAEASQSSYQELMGDLGYINGRLLEVRSKVLDEQNERLEARRGT
ncbi:DUF4157 domain-containing protein [Streptomyces californicus]|uniref:eCIS core domain-containing protein n=1 Tax=Streptomyces californicus TaxID=67351 RepID=UPI0037025406